MQQKFQYQTFLVALLILVLGILSLPCGCKDDTYVDEFSRFDAYSFKLHPPYIDAGVSALSQDSEPIAFWNNSFGGEDWDLGHSVVECNDGGFVAVGYTYSFGEGGSDLWILKTDSSGNLVWNYTFGGSGDDRAYAIVECSDGGFATVGYNAQIDSGWDIWLLRIDDDGNHEWNKTFGGPNYDEGWDLVEVSTGGFAIAGIYSYGAEGWDMWVLRTDENGNHMWNKTIGGNGDEKGISLVECSSGGFAIAGITDSYGSGFYDYWLVRTNENGETLWNRTYGGASYEECWTMLECSNGGYLLGGMSWSFGESDIMWIVRTDDEGNQLWNTTYSGNFKRAMIESREGGFVFVTGGWYIHVVRIDAMGGIVYTHGYDFGNIEIVWDIIECNNSGFVVIGYNSTFVGGPKEHIYDLMIMKVPDPPFWENWSGEIHAELGFSFRYDLNATIPHGLDGWWLEGTTSFSIDSVGILTNQTELAVGTYVLTVACNDTLGNALKSNLLVIIEDTTPPHWLVAPTDVILEYGETSVCALSADDFSELIHWGVNDTVHFTIDNTGLITTANQLSPGKYGLKVWVNDTYHNQLMGTFTVTVEDVSTTTTTPATTQTTTTTTGTTSSDLFTQMIQITAIVSVVGIVFLIILYLIRKYGLSRKISDNITDESSTSS